MVLKVNLDPLPFSYDSLEPYISEETLRVHHDKHHQAYTDKFNAALEAEGIDEKSVLDVFRRVSDFSMAVRNQGGGYWNHQFYWESLAPNQSPNGKILELIERDFGSFENFKSEFSNNAISLFGSGWTWLGVDSNGKLVIDNTKNQDNVYMDVVGKDYVPLLVIDVWEHAYYIDVQNRRPEYVENFFKVINWDKVNQRLEEAGL